MAGSSSSNDEEPISGINVTPLVDVVLVLLVIFMISAPFLYQTSINVQLPEASTGEQTEKTLWQFTINRAGEVVYQEKTLSWEDAQKAISDLEKHPDRNPAQPVMISADRETPHGLVIKLMDMLRRSGFSRLGLNVDSGS